MPDLTTIANYPLKVSESRNVKVWGRIRYWKCVVPRTYKLYLFALVIFVRSNCCHRMERGTWSHRLFRVSEFRSIVIITFDPPYTCSLSYSNINPEVHACRAASKKQILRGHRYTVRIKRLSAFDEMDILRNFSCFFSHAATIKNSFHYII